MKDSDSDDDEEVASQEQQENTLLKNGGSIFDDDMVETYRASGGKQGGRCKWCDKTFAALNATKPFDI